MPQIPAVSGTYVNPRGTILGAGNTSSENSVNVGNGGVGGSKITLTQKTVIQSAFKQAAVTITSVADSGDDDLCKFTLNTHGLEIGQYLMISGASAKQLNRVHKIVAKDTNTFTTNV